MGLIALMLVSKGKKALSIFPKTEEVLIRFRERGVSGGPLTSWRARMSGARKTLEVIVTEDELWIRPVLIAAGFRHLDLIHKVKLNDVKKTEIDNLLVRITFLNESLETNSFALSLKNPNQFLQAINHT